MSHLDLMTDTWSPDDITALIARAGGSGRARTSLTPELIAGLANARQMGLSMSAACRLAGVRPQTVKEWRARSGQPFETLALVLDACDAALEQRLVGELMRSVLATDNPAQILKVLARYFPETWGDKDPRLKVEHEVTIHPAISAAMERVRAIRSEEVIELEDLDG